MRIPTRAAPRPPGNLVAQRNAVWSSNNDLFGASLMPHSTQKKKPPPRPPPPKFLSHNAQCQKGNKPKKPARPTELLTNLFGRKTTKHQQNTIAFSSNRPSNSTFQSLTESNGTVSLIDLSPPGSPTFTTRSSSDGVSVDSFGSDGNSNPSAFTSSGNTSQTESAFEDDFDFFGGLSNQKNTQNDPWKLSTNQDPFAPLQNNSSNNYTGIKHVGNTSFFAFGSDCSTENQMLSNKSTSNVAQSMPTIIRARPIKPCMTKNSEKNLTPNADQFNVKSSVLLKNTMPLSEPMTLDVNNIWSNEFRDEPSPPMPSIPPPAPPSEYLTEFNEETTGSRESPYGIALYDFPASQPDDLPLKEGDVVSLIKVINDDWLEGRVGSRQGMFPANFIDIKVPLPGSSGNIVNALYTFNGETWEDLTFEEGAKITVLSRLSDNWLYGECNGKRGQFPVNYIDRIPFNFSKCS